MELSKTRCGMTIGVLLAIWQPGPALAEPAREPVTCPPQVGSERDGQHDFDFEFGTWTTHVRRLQDPLSGTTTWVEYQGTSVVRELLGGRANLVELDVAGPSGRIEGLSLRLYNPESRQWSLHFASIRNGVLTAPVTGGFSGRCAEFHGQDTLDGRAILVRFVISIIAPNAASFEQAFSADGGRTWEVNWIATDTRQE